MGHKTLAEKRIVPQSEEIPKNLIFGQKLKNNSKQAEDAIAEEKMGFESFFDDDNSH